jgi:hypothetical protein
VPKFDERFFTMLKNDATIAGVVSNRIYHIEVLQAVGTTPLSKFPAIVYEVQSDQPDRELNGRSGNRIAIFTVFAFSKLSSDIRSIAERLDDFCEDVTIAEANSFLYMHAEDVTDEFEVPFEYDEKAIKHTTMSITVIYAEDAE